MVLNGIIDSKILKLPPLVQKKDNRKIFVKSLFQMKLLRKLIYLAFFMVSCSKQLFLTPPTTIYTLMNPRGPKIFTLINLLTILMWRRPWMLTLLFPVIITASLKIIENKKLRKFFTKGSMFCENRIAD